MTAPVVKWIFKVRRAGWSIAAIARRLNERGIPCPSAADRVRHRPGEGWLVRTVASIVENPRYTGRQVWNRQRTDRDPGSPRQSWNDHLEWIIPEGPVHPPLVSEKDFVAVQAMRAARAAGDGGHHVYRLRGLIVCGWCGRRMDAHWVNGRAGHRCRQGHASPRSRPPDRPPNLYVREDRLLDLLTARLDLADPDEIGPYLEARNPVIVYSSGGVGVRPANDVRSGLLAGPVSMG